MSRMTPGRTRSARRGLGRSRLPLLAVSAVFIIGACLGDDPPSPTAAPTAAIEVDGTAPAPETAAPATTEPVDGGGDGDGDGEPQVSPEATTSGLAQPGVTAPPLAGNTLVVVAPQPPTRLFPPATNAAERLLLDLLYEPLYRLDADLRPVAALARDLPEVSGDGKTWRIPIRSNGRFHDGQTVTPEDVEFTFDMARAPTCPLGRTLCDAVADRVVDVTANNRNVEIKLDAPYAPFMADVLAQLPILSEAAVERAAGRLRSAADLGENRPDKVIKEISDDLLRDACTDVEKPEGCALVDHRRRLENVLGRANVVLPQRSIYTNDAGIFDEDAYTTELLDRIGSLAQVLTSDGRNFRAAALPLLDITAAPLGGGPYWLRNVRDDGTYVLVSHKARAGGAPSIGRIEIQVERNSAESVTRLLSGEADWVLEVGSELAQVVSDAPAVAAAERPLGTQRGILFNVRADRVYFDVAARRAFAACIDRETLATQLDTERAVATTPFAAQTWATPDAQPWPYDPDAGNALLDQTGWVVGADGVRAKDGVRLSSTMAVRPSRVDVFTFANAAAQQLADCGIELIVEELDLTGDTMLSQLQWPNDFDTLLMSRRLGLDPDAAVRMFETDRITSEDNQADANPSGFTSELTDFRVDHARSTLDEAERSEDYAGIQSVLDDDIPYWPLWYDTSMSALSHRVQRDGAPIDPSQTRYAWDVVDWTLDG